MPVSRSAPVKVFAPVIVVVPAPFLVRPPVPETTPDQVVLASVPPKPSVPEPRETAPAPASDPTVSEKLLSEKVAPEVLQGPVVNPEGRTDVVADQGEVDDLLASLGF